MSHIFISYTRNDEAYRDKLVAWLKAQNYSEHHIWYDRHIGSGNSWRDEIATALNEAFVVLVVVSQKSMESVYCTYEWAYAMGQGIPVFPLIFDEVKLMDVVAPLASKQWIDCTKDIPLSLQEHLDHLKSVPPPVAVINKAIYEAIYDTHRRFFILGWVGKEITALDDEEQQALLDCFMRGAFQAREKLETLMLDKAFAFNSKQYRLCWRLIDLLKEISALHQKYDRYFFDRLFPQFESTWLPAFEYFEGDGWWSKWVRRYFEWDLENEWHRRDVLTELVRAFPRMDATAAEMLIQNLSLSQKHQPTS